MDEGAFVLDYITPQTHLLQETNRMLLEIEGLLRETPETELFAPHRRPLGLHRGRTRATSW
jgi:hypothetical protein